MYTGLFTFLCMPEVNSRKTLDCFFLARLQSECSRAAFLQQKAAPVHSLAVKFLFCDKTIYTAKEIGKKTNGEKAETVRYTDAEKLGNHWNMMKQSPEGIHFLRCSL